MLPENLLSSPIQSYMFFCLSPISVQGKIGNRKEKSLLKGTQIPECLILAGCFEKHLFNGEVHPGYLQPPLKVGKICLYLHFVVGITTLFESHCCEIGDA